MGTDYRHQAKVDQILKDKQDGELKCDNFLRHKFSW